jgi:hypothetical protein
MLQMQMQQRKRNGDGMDEFLVGGGGAVLAPTSSVQRAVPKVRGRQGVPHSIRLEACTFVWSQAGW